MRGPDGRGANGRSGHSLTSQKRVVAIGSTVKRTAACGEGASAKFSARSDGEDLRRTRLSLNRDRLAIVAKTDTKDSRFPSESAFCSLHRFGDLRDWCSSFRMRFEFLNVFLRPRTAMRGRFLRRHEQSP